MGGQFVMSVPISKHILQDAQYTDEGEFTHTTYSAVTCQPEEFPNKYQLRAKRLQRHIKVALVIVFQY